MPLGQTGDAAILMPQSSTAWSAQPCKAAMNTRCAARTRRLRQAGGLFEGVLCAAGAPHDALLLQHLDSQALLRQKRGCHLQGKQVAVGWA